MNKRRSRKPLVTHRLLLVLLTLIVTLSFTLVLVSALPEGVDPMFEGLIGIGVGLAIGLAGLGAGLGMGSAGAAAVGAISERPEVFGKAMIFIVFIEAIAIYGLLIAFMLLGKMV